MLMQGAFWRYSPKYCFLFLFSKKSRSRKQFGTINKLYSRHFTSDNIREGNKKWRSCIQNKRWDFEKQKEEKNKPFRSLSTLTPLLVLHTHFPFEILQLYRKQAFYHNVDFDPKPIGWQFSILRLVIFRLWPHIVGWRVVHAWEWSTADS